MSAVVRPEVAESDPSTGELAFQRHPATAAVKAGEHGTVVSQHPLAPAVPGHRRVEVCHDVAHLKSQEEPLDYD
jgi:hypothetical protein